MSVIDDVIDNITDYGWDAEPEPAIFTDEQLDDIYGLKTLDDLLEVSDDLPDLTDNDLLEVSDDQ